MSFMPYLFLCLIYALLIVAYWLPETSEKAGRINTVSLGLSFYATMMGGWALSAPAEVGARFGFVGALGLDLNFLDFLKAEFGSAVYAITVTVSLAFMVTLLAAELTVIGSITSTLGIPASAGILPVTILTWIHSSFSEHTIASHGLQGGLCIVASVAGISALLIGSFQGVQAHDIAENLGLSSTSTQGLLTLALSTSSAELFNFAEWQRVATAESAKQRLASLGIACVLNFVTLSGFGLVGWVESHKGLLQPSLAFQTTLESLNVWPRYVVFMMGMLLAASTSDALGFAITSLSVRLCESRKKTGAMISLIIAYLPGCLIASMNVSVVRLFLYVDILTSIAAPPIFTAALLKGSKISVLSGLICAITCVSIFTYFTDLLHDIESIDAVPFFICLLTSGLIGTATPILVQIGKRMTTKH